MKTILIAAAALLAMAAPAAASCFVNDNSGTPLNLRASPNGRIIGTLRNGVELQLLDQTTLAGHVWVNVGRPDSIGWVAREMLDCERAETASQADTYHYACRSDGEDRYALTVDTGRKIVKLVEVAPPHTLTTFRILRTAPVDVCAKEGWILNGGATFCTATQGIGILNWHGPHLGCDNADTE